MLANVWGLLGLKLSTSKEKKTIGTHSENRSMLTSGALQFVQHLS